jgi:hypothetical protein
MFATEHHSLTSKFPVYLYRMSIETKLNLFKTIGNIKAPGKTKAFYLRYLLKTCTYLFKVCLTEMILVIYSNLR